MDKVKGKKGRPTKRKAVVGWCEAYRQINGKWPSAHKVAEGADVSYVTALKYLNEARRELTWTSTSEEVRDHVDVQCKRGGTFRAVTFMTGGGEGEFRVTHTTAWGEVIEVARGAAPSEPAAKRVCAEILREWIAAMNVADIEEGSDE